MSDEDFKIYYNHLFNLGQFPTETNGNTKTLTVFDNKESPLFQLIFKLWLFGMIPAVVMAIYLLYLMEAPAPSTNNKTTIQDPKTGEEKADYSPTQIVGLEDQQSREAVNGQYHHFEDADLGIKLAKWMDMLSVTQIFHDQNEEEIRGVYHFLDQCKEKLGFDYIQVNFL